MRLHQQAKSNCKWEPASTVAFFVNILRKNPPEAIKKNRQNHHTKAFPPGTAQVCFVKTVNRQGIQHTAKHADIRISKYLFKAEIGNQNRCHSDAEHKYPIGICHSKPDHSKQTCRIQHSLSIENRRRISISLLPLRRNADRKLSCQKSIPDSLHPHQMIEQISASPHIVHHKRCGSCQNCQSQAKNDCFLLH